MSHKTFYIIGAIFAIIFFIPAIIMTPLGDYMKVKGGTLCKTTCQYYSSRLDYAQDSTCCVSHHRHCDSNGKNCYDECTAYSPCCEITCSCQVGVLVCEGTDEGNTLNTTRSSHYTQMSVCNPVTINDDYCEMHRCSLSSTAWPCWAGDHATPVYDYDLAKRGVAVMIAGAVLFGITALILMSIGIRVLVHCSGRLSFSFSSKHKRLPDTVVEMAPAVAFVPAPVPMMPAAPVSAVPEEVLLATSAEVPMYPPTAVAVAPQPYAVPPAVVPQPYVQVTPQ
jgi:hypothetical protein